MSQPVDIDEYTQLIVRTDTELQEEGIDAATRQRLCRLRGLYAYWLQFPTKSAKEIVEYDINMFHIGRSQAYDDLHLTEVLLGSLRQTSKEFMRWKINQDLEYDLKIARHKGDLRAVASIEKNRIMNNRTDKDDEPELAFDKIVPQPFIPSDDPTDAGVPKLPDLRGHIRTLEKRYGRNLTPDVEDAEYEEIKDDDGESKAE